ncbi:MAG: hypothetical protein KAH17_10390 [Bacteroidales bacterium]|nr:hypothetical protein [Bacteroidales bacterium]
MKRINRASFYISLIALVIFTSCDKDDPNDDPNPDTSCFEYIDLASHLESAGKTMFINTNLGWVLGGTSLIQTEDGGASWTSINTEMMCAHEQIQFINSTDGYLIDDFSNVRYTNDKGASWTEMTIPNPDNDQLLFYATASNSTTTVLLAWVNTDISALFFVSNTSHSVVNTVLINEMIVPGKKMHLSESGAIIIAPAKREGHNQREIAYSADNGSSWTYTEIAGDGEVKGNPWDCDISFPDDNTGYFAGKDNGYDKAYIYKTSNGGSSWTKISIPSSVMHDNFTQIDFADANHGLGIGLGSIHKTTDGGENWIEFPCFGEKYISTFSVSYPEADHGFITGLNGADADYSYRIYKYTGQ